MHGHTWSYMPCITSHTWSYMVNGHTWSTVIHGHGAYMVILVKYNGDLFGGKATKALKWFEKSKNKSNLSSLKPAILIWQKFSKKNQSASSKVSSLFLQESLRLISTNKSFGIWHQLVTKNTQNIFIVKESGLMTWYGWTKRGKFKSISSTYPPICLIFQKCVYQILKCFRKFIHSLESISFFLWIEW